MAIVTVSGEPGCRTGEIARLAAQRLGYEHLSAARLDDLLIEEFGQPGEKPWPVKAWPAMAASVVVRLATQAHLVIGVDGAELLFEGFPALLRVRIVAHANRRTGNVMLDAHLDRTEARLQLKTREREARRIRRSRFRRANPAPENFDLILNAGTFDGEVMAELIEAAARARSLDSFGFLAPAVEVQRQFQLRLQLARFGMTPKGHASLKKAQFYHPSEEIFANLLDFYRIAWEYEPKSFPIAWDASGRVLEAFTPDFYLPESNMYVELTTMKQSLVTKKNRKIRLLREIYPGVNIQVFYQKDLQDLVLKYGLTPSGAGNAE
jgi:cytidylate kinase